MGEEPSRKKVKAFGSQRNSYDISAGDASGAAPGARSRVTISYSDSSDMTFFTSAACMACPAFFATTQPSSGRPISARSPIRSNALWRQHSSGKRKPPSDSVLPRA